MPCLIFFGEEGQPFIAFHVRHQPPSFTPASLLHCSACLCIYGHKNPTHTTVITTSGASRPKKTGTEKPAVKKDDTEKKQPMSHRNRPKKIFHDQNLKTVFVPESDEAVKVCTITWNIGRIFCFL